MVANADARFDVVVVGGGIMGSSVAYWLAASPHFSGSIAVVEKDPSYVYSTTARSNSSIRMQFSTALNIEMSKFGIGFVKNIKDYLSTDSEEPQISFVENGYLFLANDAAGQRILLRNHEIQRRQGIVDVVVLGPDELAARFPWLNIDGVTCGTLGLRNEGWFDAYSLLQAFKKKARSLGVTYIADEIVAMKRAGGHIAGVVAKARGDLEAGVVVNAAGAWARQIAAMAGVDLPVVPRRRFVFVFDCPTRIQGMPLLIDPEGFYVRPERDCYLCGMKPPADNDPDSHDFDVDYQWFDDELWPRLARWVPAFETVKVRRAWTGHYEYNTFDRNALLGRHPTVDNLYFCNGFSGHGMQQSPAAGRGISELIIHGRYETLDLSEFSVARLAENRPIVEQYVV
jgi:FAD-dependent oxidoreductase domain-containing protein 1